ncbi:hypothetical protein AVEN_149426-1 [Araneus ventricosus]|uniref:CCHC-type domain-containing protein n=1 Tax=Araneus ventricosus TaxID=182803 RepID=A0A4Y2CS96_ARAVE|nr:hypothetical protein AVEN_149426-1 [Araneus ventricosus]
MADEGEALRNPSLLSSIKNLNGPNAPEFFRTLEETAPLGLWSKDQLIIITKLKLEGRARSFFEASLAGQVLDYDSLKEKFLNQFQKRDNFASCFTQFLTAVQLPSERVRDFASRIEGLAQNSFGDKTVEKGEMSKQLKDKMILSQFLAGLRPNLKAQMLIENPKDFAAAVELGDRIEMAQAMLTPNINVLDSRVENPHKVIEAVQTSGETVAKTLELVCKQLERLNDRMDRIEKKETRDNRNSNEGSNVNNVRPPVRCFHCGRVGHVIRDCRQRMAEARERSYGQRPYNRGNNFRNRLDGRNEQPNEGAIPKNE